MPELPDVDVYVTALDARLIGRTLDDVRLGNPFVLRSVEPPLSDAGGRRVAALARIGKRVAIGLTGDFWLVIHLMIGGRLHWFDTPPPLAAKNRLVAFDFDVGSLLLTEAGTKKRASLHAVLGRAALAAHDPGGIDPLTCTRDAFRAALTRENHTLKRALTDPRLIAGIGNAYSDEILHAARLSPVALTKQLTAEELGSLFEATRATLADWRQRLLDDAAGEMPKKVTAFRDGMKVHGRFAKPCPDCGQPVQRIRYKDNETNYCAACQTGGRILKDRALSRLLRGDWPRTLDDL